MAARRYARQGTPVFPCHPKLKTPLTENGFHAATTDLDQIDKWWTEYPDANIAFVPASVNQGIVDVDGEEGIAAWRALFWLEGYDDTFVVKTPRGGEHWYFKGTIPPSQWAPGRRRCLGVHIDTRGVGSYALLPPSVTADGIYTVLHDRPLADVPAWILTKLAVQEKRRAATAKLDQPHNLDRARRMLQSKVKHGHVAVAGEGGNNLTFHLACEVFDAGLSTDAAYQVLAETWNEFCDPPWSSEELRAIVENAARYQQNEPGSKAEAPGVETFKGVGEAEALKAETEAADQFVVQRFDEFEPEAETWLWRNRFPAGSLALISGFGGDGKTSVLLDLAARITTGAGWPDGEPMDGPGNVIYMSSEDSPSRVLLPRFMAAGGDRSRMYNIRGMKADDAGGLRLFHLKEDLQKLTALVRRIGNVTAVIFDPLSSYFGDTDTWKESAVRDALTPVADWCDQHKIAVIGNSHLGKAGGRNVNSQVLNSVAIVNIARSIYMVGRDPDDKARRFFLPTKGNNGPEMQGLSFRLVSKMATPTITVGKPVWETAPTDASADEMIAAANGQKRSRKDTEREDCIAYLRELLAEGPQDGSKVMQALVAEGFKPGLIGRAKRALAVVDTQTPEGWTMGLPGVPGAQPPGFDW